MSLYADITSDLIRQLMNDHISAKDVISQDNAWIYHSKEINGLESLKQ